MQRNGGADGDSLSGAEEAGDDADGGKDRVVVPDLRAGEEQKTKDGADAVTRDHGRLQGPSIDEDSGEDAKDRDWEHVGDLNAGDLLWGRFELEGKDADNSEEREEVSKDGDGLRVPEAAHHWDAHDLAHGERR